jgi:RNA polymerase sigma-70 factor (ECF subfamily)
MAVTRDELSSLFIDLREPLRRFLLRRLRCPDTAADLVQDLYLRIERAVNLPVGSGAARLWLFRVAANLAADHVKLQTRRAELLRGALAPFLADVPMRSPEDCALDTDEIARLQSALTVLPSRSSEILYLSRIEGLTHTEIAKRLRISKSSVEKHVIRALRHCRQALQDNDW